jgi:hypothetical protein
MPTRRLRVNFLSGTTTGSLNASSTGTSQTLTSSGFSALPVVTNGTHHLPLVLGATSATPEIVWVTAHSSSSTTVTIARGMEGTSAPSWASGTSWQHGPVASDFITLCTAATRPALASDGTNLPYHGQVIFETDTSKTYWYDASTAAWIQDTVGSSFTAKGALLAGTGTSTYSALTLGTNGQYLKVNTANATGLEWAAISSATEVSKTDFNAKGDLLVGTANDTYSTLGVGTNGYVLTADSAEATGMKWSTAAATATEISKSLIDAKGDIVVGSANDTPARLAVGTDGYVLTAASAQATGLSWTDLSSTYVAKSVFTAKGQVLGASASGTPAVLAITGASTNYVLAYDTTTSTGLKWLDSTSINVARSGFTASGDILVGSGGSSYFTLGKGATNGQMLTVDSTATATGGITWKAPANDTFLLAADINAKGDLLVGSADNTYTRVPVGTDGQVLTASAAATGGVAWATAAGATVAGTRAFIFVAASGATAAMKAAADYVCDGTADEVQIKAALDDIRTWQTNGWVNGGEVVLSSGQFNIAAADQISIPADTTLRGTGGGLNGSDYGTVLKWFGAGPAASGAIVKIQGTSSTSRINGARVQSLGIRGHDANTSNLICLSLKYANVCHISDVGFWNGRRYGVYAYGWSDSVMERCRFDYCGTNDSTNRAALHIEDDDGVWANDNLIIRECWWEQCEDRCVTVSFSNVTGNGADYPYAITFDKCKFENTVGMRGGSANSMVRISGVSIRVTNCYFFIGNLAVDNATNRLGAALHFSTAYGCWAKDNQFSHNSSSTSGASVDAFILIGSGFIEGAIITGNRFEGGKAATSAAIKYTGTPRQVYASHNYYSYNADNTQTRTVYTGTVTTVLSGSVPASAAP